MADEPTRAPLDETAERIREYLADHPELLKKEYRGVEGKHPLYGHCYVATEAYFYARGGEDSGLEPRTVQHEGTTHWWLETEDGQIIDLTAEQFDTPVPYGAGTSGTGFYATYDGPSDRAEQVLDALDLS